MTPSDARDGFRFRGGHPALDLTATLAGRRKPEPRDLLAAPADLDRWLAAAGAPVPQQPATMQDLEAARTLRESCYRAARAIVGGATPQAADRELLNQFAALAPPRPALTPAGLRWQADDARAALAGVAREAVLLFGGPQAGLIRGCSGAGCAILFLDLSRAAGRRWCAMSACGNRAKASAFRARNTRP